MPSAKAEIRIRPARASELADITLLCLRSKAYWGYDADFMAACRAELALTEADLAAGTLNVAERDGVVVGVAQVEGKVLEKLFVEPSLIGTGIGAHLFAEALASAREAGARELVIEADPGAVASTAAWAPGLRAKHPRAAFLAAPCRVW